MLAKHTFARLVGVVVAILTALPWLVVLAGGAA